MKRLTSFLLVVVLLLSFAGTAFADEGTTPPDQTEDTTEVSYLDDTGDPVSDPAEESEEEDHQPEELSVTQAEHPRVEQIYGGGEREKLLFRTVLLNSATRQTRKLIFWVTPLKTAKRRLN